MPATTPLQQTIDRFWDTIPPVWGRVRNNARSNAIQGFNITLIQFHLMRHIRHGARTVCELADKQLISRPAASQAVDLLVAKGLVSRRPAPADRRRLHLELTPAGGHLLDETFRRSRQWMEEKMAALTPADLETLRQALAILKDTFDPAP